MRIRHAASALVALGAASACALAGTMIHRADTQSTTVESALRSSTWSVQASTDFGTTWTAPVSSLGGHFPALVDTAALRSRPVYQPLTLRTTSGSLDTAHVTIGTGALIQGDPDAAAALRIRAVESHAGTCASSTFAGASRNLLENSALTPQPVNTPTTSDPLRLPAATRTTAGPAITVCLELSIDSAAPVRDSQLTLAWPVTVIRVGNPA